MPRSHTQFRPGQSGNPAGRPKGSRNQINERILELLRALTKGQDGADSLKGLRDDDPTAFWRIVAGLLPKQVNADVEHKGQVSFVMKGPDGQTG